MFAFYIDVDPRRADGRQVVFYAADDDAADADFADLLDRFGFAPVHVGPLRERRQADASWGLLSALHVRKRD
jgi:predicted dinucleotide-binding enzyme